MDNPGPDGTSCNSWDVYSFIRQFFYFSKIEQCLERNTPSGPQVHLNCPSGVSFVALSCSLPRFWFKSLWSLTDHKRQFLQGNLFLLAMHEMPLYLCSIFCSRSLVQLSAVSYHVWSAEHAPNCIYPVTLRKSLVLRVNRYFMRCHNAVWPAL